MGRKIPGKKHHGTKDPLQQQRVRQDSIKNKINCPPVDVDDQPIPDNLQKIVQWKKLDKQNLSIRKMKKSNIYKSWLLGKTDIEQGKNNKIKLPSARRSEQLYSQIKEVDEELVEEYNNLQYDSENPNQPKKKKKGDMLQIMFNAGGKQKKQKSVNDTTTISKIEKMKMRLAAKKHAKIEKIQESEEEMDNLIDIIEFGEVAHAPPILNLPTRNKVRSGDSKPGQRVLLLKQFLPTTDHANVPQSLKYKKEKKKSKMSVEEQNRLESNRLQAVQGYRKLKASKKMCQDR